MPRNYKASKDVLTVQKAFAMQGDALLMSNQLHKPYVERDAVGHTVVTALASPASSRIDYELKIEMDPDLAGCGLDGQVVIAWYGQYATENEWYFMGVSHIDISGPKHRIRVVARETIDKNECDFVHSCNLGHYGVDKVSESLTIVRYEKPFNHYMNPMSGTLRRMVSRFANMVSKRMSQDEICERLRSYK